MQSSTHLMNVVTWEAIYVLFPKLTFSAKQMLTFYDVGHEDSCLHESVDCVLTPVLFRNLDRSPEIHNSRLVGDKWTCCIPFEGEVVGARFRGLEMFKLNENGLQFT